jgi:hypothetical protein
MSDTGKWLNINDYSVYRRISVSTIRRYIKSDRVSYKKEDGKYLIFVSEENFDRRREVEEKETIDLKNEIKDLKMQNKQLIEEIDELKMLIGLYEGRKEHPPELPFCN